MPKRKIKLLALTGGFGSGKSTALSFLKKKGAYVIDADKLVHQILKSDRGVLRAIKKKLGSTNKKRLAEIIFNSKAKRSWLEKLIHPVVRERMNDQINKSKKKVIVCDIPLLFESGWKKRFKQIIVVNAPMRLRERWLKKRGFGRTEIRKRMKAQWPLSKKVKKADFVIENNMNKQNLKKQIDQLWTILTTGRNNGFSSRKKVSH